MIKKSILLFINKNLINKFQFSGEIRNIRDINRLESNLKKKVNDILLNIKICDPACGAGVFLISSAKFLYEILSTNF